MIIIKIIYNNNENDNNNNYHKNKNNDNYNEPIQVENVISHLHVRIYLELELKKKKTIYVYFCPFNIEKKKWLLVRNTFNIAHSFRAYDSDYWWPSLQGALLIQHKFLGEGNVIFICIINWQNNSKLAWKKVKELTAKKTKFYFKWLLKKTWESTLSTRCKFFRTF